MSLTLVSKTIGDGNGGTFSAEFYTDGTNFYPAPILYDPNGVFAAALAGASVAVTGPLTSAQAVALGLATAAGQTTQATALGQIHTDLTPATGLPIKNVSGVGAQGPIPTSGTNASPVVIGAPPAGVSGVRLYAPSGATIPICLAASASAAAAAFASGAFKNFVPSSDGPNWDENLNGMNIYVGAMTGLPPTPGANAPTASFRYI